MRFQFVLITPQRAQVTAVNDGGVFAVVRDSHVNLAQIDPGNAATGPLR